MKPLVLVTGSSGLIGSRLCKKLKGKYTVIGFDKEGPPYPPDGIECLFVDLSSDESVQNALHIVETRYGRKIACVVHLAAYYDFSGRPSELYEIITVQGTQRLIRELSHFTVEQFMFSSSMLVHKPTAPNQFITEDSPLQATWDYPASKIKTEKLILEQCPTIPKVILRIAGVYDEACHSVPIANQIQRIFENRVTGHFYPGTLNAAQSFVHLDDLLDAFISVINSRKALPNELTLLIGESRTVPYGEMQHLIAHNLNYAGWSTATIPKPIAKLGAWLQNTLPGQKSFIQPWMIDRADDSYRLDISRAERYIKWQPKHNLRDELPAMIQQLKNDPIGWYHTNRLQPPAWLERRSA
jgi:nucleoside-diphosphate-sugar epimerase